MDPQLFDLIVEGIAAGTCPIADDADLRVLLAHLETLARKGSPHGPATADTAHEPDARTQRAAHGQPAADAARGEAVTDAPSSLAPPLDRYLSCSA